MKPLKLIVKISYPNSLEKPAYEQLLYFYDPLDGVEEKLKKVWAPNASAEFFLYSSQSIGCISAGQNRGQWDWEGSPDQVRSLSVPS